MTTIPAWADVNEDTRKYYQDEWGRKPSSDRDVFEILSLLTFQAGLTWSTVLAKREKLSKAFKGFNIEKVAAMDGADVARLVEQDSPIKNERKIRAVINNAQSIVNFRGRSGEAEPDAMVSLLRASAGESGEKWPSNGEEQVAFLLHVFGEWEFQFVGPKVARALVESLGYALPWAKAQETA